MQHPLSLLDVGFTSIANSLYHRGRMHLASQDYAAAAEDFRMALTLGTHYTQQCELLLSTCRCALNPRENIRLN